MNGLVVCVDYADILRITLPRCMPHFERILVVSEPHDVLTSELVAQYKYADVSLYCTDSFYRNGAYFNKGLAIEEGLDVLGRQGWITIFDADIVMPDMMPLDKIEPGYLYSPRRRLCIDPKAWDGTNDWSKYRIVPDKEYAGYFQLFHADDPALFTRPWYGVDWKSAAGCDSDFQAKWPEKQRARLDFEVLHLGSLCDNWCGRVTPYLNGSMPAEANLRSCNRRNMLHARRTHGYAKEKIGKDS